MVGIFLEETIKSSEREGQGEDMEWNWYSHFFP